MEEDKRHPGAWPKAGKAFSEFLDRLQTFCSGYDEDRFEKYKESFTKQEREMYRAFIGTFGTCPMCGATIDVAVLDRIYFSPQEDEKPMVERMKRAIDVANVRIGVPCCKCFKKLFPTF